MDFLSKSAFVAGRYLSLSHTFRCVRGEELDKKESKAQQELKPNSYKIWCHWLSLNMNSQPLPGSTGMRSPGLNR